MRPGSNPLPTLEKPKLPNGLTGTASPINPSVDGVLKIDGPYGKCVLQLELSEGMNSAHIETKIGQRLYTIDIRPNRGLATTDLVAAVAARADHMADLLPLRT